MAALPVRDVHLCKAAGSCGVHRRDDLRDMWFDEGPSSLTQHNNRNLAAREILLIPEILVCGNEHFEPGGLGLFEQLAVLQLLPSTGAGLCDHMAIDQKARKRSR